MPVLMPPTGVDGNRKIMVAIFATSRDQTKPIRRFSAGLRVIESAGFTAKPFAGNGCARAGPPKPLRFAKKLAIVGAGLGLKGSVISSGKSCWAGLGVNDTSVDPVANETGGAPGGPFTSTTARKRTFP